MSDIYAAILKRKSVRQFSGQNLDQKEVKEIMKYYETLKQDTSKMEWLNINHKKIRVQYVGNFEPKIENIFDTKQFIAIIAPKNACRTTLMKVGYLFERIILFAVSRNIGTCWIGGRENTNILLNHLKEKKVERKDFGFDPSNEQIICMSPINKEKNIKVPRAPRFPNDHLFFEGNLDNPLDISKLPKGYQEAFNLVKWAPNSVNTQKWRIIKEVGKNIFHFFTNPSSSFYTNIDIGIAISHWEIGMNHFSISGKFEKEKDLDINQFLPTKSKKLEIDESFFDKIHNGSYNLEEYENEVQLKEKNDTGKCIYFMTWKSLV